MKFLLTFLVLALAACLGCERKDPERGAPPPPPPAPVVAAQCNADARFLGALGVSKTEGYCVDKSSDIRRFGLGAALGLGEVCTQLFNGECELYKSYGLRSVTTAQITPRAGGDYFVQLTLSQFDSPSGAYGFYNHRILADDHPKQLTVESVAVTGRAALGLGVAYLYRGAAVWELAYLSDVQSPSQIKVAAPPALRTILRVLAESAPGEDRPPFVAARLEQEPGLLPLGVRYRDEGILGIAGAGSYALGYFRGETPYRILLAERSDERAAKDLFSTILRSYSYKKLKPTKVHRVRLSLSDQDDQRWYLSLRGRYVVGVSRDAEVAEVKSNKEREREEDAFERKALSLLAELKIETAN